MRKFEVFQPTLIEQLDQYSPVKTLGKEKLKLKSNLQEKKTHNLKILPKTRKG
jgi:hypothetical protein